MRGTRYCCGAVDGLGCGSYDGVEFGIQPVRALFRLCNMTDAKLTAAVTEMLRWKDAVIDAGVVNWTLSTENKDDPRKAINDLLCQVRLESLDPAISKPAAEWRDRIEKAEAERDALIAQIEGLREKVMALFTIDWTVLANDPKKYLTDESINCCPWLRPSHDPEKVRDLFYALLTLCAKGL